jgi:hypothetical protein
MEVPRGPVDLRTTFDRDVVLVNSSGELLPVNEYGILMQSLQMGESYFAVIILKSELIYCACDLALYQLHATP